MVGGSKCVPKKDFAPVKPKPEDHTKTVTAADGTESTENDGKMQSTLDYNYQEELSRRTSGLVQKYSTYKDYQDILKLLLKPIHKVIEQERFLAAIIPNKKTLVENYSLLNDQYPSTTTTALDMLNAFKTKTTCFAYHQLLHLGVESDAKEGTKIGYLLTTDATRCNEESDKEYEEE
eukprot:jgi/Psemu1/23834/gm1.23834_g